MGTKSTFRLLNRGSAKALDKVVELDGMCSFPFSRTSFRYQMINVDYINPAETRKEALIIKTTIHDVMNKMIRVGIAFILRFLCLGLMGCFFYLGL